MREVYIAAVGLTKVDLTGSIFGNIFDLFQSAYRRALAESEVREFDALQVGIMHAEEFESRANIAAKVADRLGLAGVPAVRSETASSTGAAVFHEACYKIRSGAASSVLVIAGERMKTVTTQVATEIMSKTVDPVERRFGFTMPALIALVTQAFFQRRGVHGARVADVLSRLMFRAHALGADNPLAAFAGKPEPLAAYFDETRNLPVATPLRRKDCSPICDGAAAIILSDRPQAVRVAGLGAATDTASLLDRVELDSLAATRRAAAFAFQQAGVADPGALEGLVVESHDAFNSLLPLNLVDLGLCDPEQALEALIGGGRGVDPATDPYAHPWSGPSGHRPVNLSGGLKSRGHPVGGTGLYQLAELYLQLTGRFPNPRAQAADARLGLSHSIGGPGNNVYVTLLERADSKRKQTENLPRPGRQAARRATPSAPGALHGREAEIEAATTIHVTASGDAPIHVALLSVAGRRVFAKLAGTIRPGDDLSAILPGRRARFLVTDDGDHHFLPL
ncbi:MAG TPA: beta-ketoacyl synthase N-terminal-like domain-containing protein [Myxococcota bacterium]|nr:beta-ketoacyl synthase N-terminal-like domain-containing protein [Myxococcota bacterium]